MKIIRKAAEKDVSRIAEILVFCNRLTFFPVFKDEEYSFGQMQVVPLAEKYLENKEMLEHTYVYDDGGTVKGMVRIFSGEIEKLYVDPCFQRQGIGEALLRFAEEKDAGYLWALEKNTGAVRFYEKHGFHKTGEKMYEEGTEEYLIKMVNEKINEGRL